MRTVPASLVFFVALGAVAAGCVHSERPKAHLAKRESLPPCTDRNRPSADTAPRRDSSSADAHTAPPITQVPPTCKPARPIQVIRRWDDAIYEAWCEKFVGTRDGPYMQWWTEDIQSEIGTYKNGKKHGKWTSFHTDGKIASEGHYDEAGKRHGLWRWWWRYEVDGEGKPLLQDAGQFFHGRAVGRWKSWDHHGKQIKKITNAVIIGSVRGRIELYINAGEPELFQAALNVLRRLTPEQRKSIQSDPKFEAALEEMRATDGAGIEPEEMNALRRALKYRE